MTRTTQSCEFERPIGAPTRRLFIRLTAAALSSLLAVGVSQAESPGFAILDELLVNHVRNGFVDYDAFAAEDGLDEVIAQIAKADAGAFSSKAERLAFHINAYNALAIQGILDGQSPSSWWGRRKFFQRQKRTIAGEVMSLEQLEHDKIISTGDPRIHFAIVCASMSCPRLASRAYNAVRLDEQLHDAATQFINDRARNRFDVDRKIAFVSKIFEWYRDDFESSGSSLQRYLARFVSNGEAQELLRNGEFEIRFVDYDWSLNGRYTGAGK